MKHVAGLKTFKELARHALQSGRGTDESSGTRSQLLEIIHNTGWLLGERALVLGTGLVVGVWVARYLGPSDFGTYSYALSFVALFGFLPDFGLQGIVT